MVESAELAKASVVARVEGGGHPIHTVVIEWRYKRGLDNLFSLYKDLDDSWMIYDNLLEVPMLSKLKKKMASWSFPGMEKLKSKPAN